MLLSQIFWQMVISLFKRCAVYTGRTMQINNIDLDLTSIYKISHECRTGVCDRQYNCCANYEVCIDTNELEIIVNHLPLAAKYAKHLLSESGFANVFDETEDGFFSIDKDEEGLCVFAYQTKDNHFLCSLHTVALDLDTSPHLLKPKCCSLWPLALSTEQPLCLTLDDEAFLFPCNKVRDDKKDLYPAIETIISTIFGDHFFNELLEKGKQRF